MLAQETSNPTTGTLISVTRLTSTAHIANRATGGAIHDAMARMNRGAKVGVTHRTRRAAYPSRMEPQKRRMLLPMCTVGRHLQRVAVGDDGGRPIAARQVRLRADAVQRRE